MSNYGYNGEWTVIAVYHDRESVERAVRRLHDDGFAMRDLSMVGPDFRVRDEPAGFVATGDYAEAGAEIGAVFGGIFGLSLGMALLILPGLGPVIAVGSIAAALAGGGEGAAAGAAIGGLAGALVGWGVHKEHALKYEAQVKAGSFLVLARGDSQTVEHAKSVLATEATERLAVYQQPLSLTSG
jgi:hypothetical protein